MKIILLFICVIFFASRLYADSRTESSFYELSSFHEMEVPARTDLLYQIASPDGKYEANVYFFKDRGGTFTTFINLSDGDPVLPPLKNRIIPLEDRIFAIGQSIAVAVRWIDESVLEVNYFSPFEGMVGRKREQWKDVEIRFVKLTAEKHE